MRKILPAISPCPPATCIPCSEDLTHELLAVYAIGHPCCCNGRVGILVRPEELQPHALDPRPRGPSEQYVPLENVLYTLVDELLQRDVKLDDEAYRRGPRRLGRVLLVG